MSVNTPFTQGPMVDIISLKEEYKAVNDILTGIFTPDIIGLDEDSASKEMKGFIQALKTTISKSTGQSISEMKTDMNTTDYCEVFKKTKECTAALSSGICYGYYITACESETLLNVNLIFMTILPADGARVQ